MASKWSLTTPWKANPWQFIQVSTARAMMAASPALSPPTRIPFLQMARAIAVADRPSEAWLEVVSIAGRGPGQVAGTSHRLASRFLMAAWTAMQRLPASQPRLVMECWIDTVSAAVGETLPVVDRAELVQRATSLAELDPESASNRLDDRLASLAMPEVLATVAICEHLRRPEDAERWLGDLLAA
jgi:hypothetical protein